MIKGKPFVKWAGGKRQIESLEMTNNKLITNLDKSYMDMLKGINDVEQYVRVSESIKKR